MKQKKDIGELQLKVDDLAEGKDEEFNVDPNGSGISGFMKNCVLWPFRFVGDTLISQGPMIFSSMIFTSIFNSSSNKISALMAPETLSWYVANKTKLNEIFVGIKSASVPYDLYSGLLNQDRLIGKQTSQIKSILKDLCDAAKNGKSSDGIDDILL